MDKLINITLLFLMSLSVFGCGTVLKTVPVNIIENKSSESILFVADPQIHNVYAMSLLQMNKVSDVFIEVAVRPPELNILAPLIFEELVEKNNKKNNPNAMIVLGDITNIACSGESRTFYKALNKSRKKNIPTLIAHGNHDSYMMGTTNYYFPWTSHSNENHSKNKEWKKYTEASRYSSSNIPIDENWWPDSNISTKAETNWNHACYQPNGDSTPMNKSRWLAQYFEFLSKQGLNKNTIKGSKTNDEFLLTFDINANSILGKNNYKIDGYYSKPKFGGTTAESVFTSVYNSFIVQSIDINKKIGRAHV